MKKLKARQAKNGHYTATLLACLFLFITACSSQKESPTQFGEPRKLEENISAAAPSTAGQDQLLRAQANCSKKVEVVFTAPVYKLLPDDRKGTPHQRFLMQLSNGRTVLVAHNTQMAPRVPMRQGDLLLIKGEYIWNDQGGVVHWTHHTDTPRHEGGYIQFKGQTYQ